MRATTPKSRFTPTRLGASLAAGAASGSLSLIDPAKLGPLVRTGLCLGTGAITGVCVWVGTKPTPESFVGRPTRGALAVGMSVIGAATIQLGFAVDSRIHRALVRGGVTHPRAVIAVGSGILNAAMFLFEPAPDCDESGRDTTPVITGG